MAYQTGNIYLAMVQYQNMKMWDSQVTMESHCQRIQQKQSKHGPTKRVISGLTATRPCSHSASSSISPKSTAWTIRWYQTWSTSRRASKINSMSTSTSQITMASSSSTPSIPEILSSVSTTSWVSLSAKAKTLHLSKILCMINIPVNLVINQIKKLLTTKIQC